ncbi:MAG: MXAN_6521/LA_1396 family lipoprotein [Leptospiraceae bacterium]|nr:MXAN_6521/LA_1396 family lipoprotein [Leptospiraceae bacterium]
MQNLFFGFLLVFLFTQCSSIQYVKKSPSLAADVATTKRILILPSTYNKISEEDAMLHDIMRQEISHHSLFIVYKAPAKFKNVCSLKEFPKIEGILTAEMRETPMGAKSEFALKGILQKCSNGVVIWESKAVDKLPLEANENMSLIKTYSEKYGKKVAKKVNAYFQLTKELVAELKGPEKLNEEEELEKIEVESE